MDKQSNSTNVPKYSTGNAAEPKITWNVPLDFNRHNLKRLSIRDLATFADAITLARDAVCGVSNQPRCSEKLDPHLDAVQEGLNNVIEMVQQIAIAFTPESRDDASARAYLIMRLETDFTDDFSALEETFDTLKAEMAPFLIEEAR